MTSARASLEALSPLPLPASVYGAVERAYASPGRAYHTLEHVLDVARRFDEVAKAGLWIRPREVFAAVLFHDAVYDAARTDNERRSAELAREVLAAANVGIELELVVDLIDATAWHGGVDAALVDEDTAHFLDCDMSILGADADAFARYDDGIRREYASVVVAHAYALGRRAFFERLLATPCIFLTPFFRDRLEARARDNLRASIASDGVHR